MGGRSRPEPGSSWDALQGRTLGPTVARVFELPRDTLRGVPWFAPLETQQVEPEADAAALESLRADPDRLRRLARAGHERANRPELDWDRIAARWQELLAQGAGS